MAKKKEKRTDTDRRNSNDKRSENFIEYFIPREAEKRSGKDRRKKDPGNR